MGRPKKIINDPPPNTPQENMLDRMVVGSLDRYEKTMKEFVPALNNLIERINILVNKSTSGYSPPPPIISPSMQPPLSGTELIDTGTQLIDSGTIPQITGDLSDRQIWYFTSGGGNNIPTEFLKQQYGKEKWQDLTKEQAIKLIGEWKSKGEKPP